MKISGPELRNIIVQALLRHSRSGLAPGAVTDDTRVVGADLDLDSLRCLEALVDIEGRLGIRLLDESLGEKALRSVGKLVAHVQAALDRAPA